MLPRYDTIQPSINAQPLELNLDFYPITSAFHTSTFFDIEKDKENSLRRGQLQLDWAKSNIGRTFGTRSRAFS